MKTLYRKNYILHILLGIYIIPNLLKAAHILQIVCIFLVELCFIREFYVHLVFCVKFSGLLDSPFLLRAPPPFFKSCDPLFRFPLVRSAPF